MSAVTSVTEIEATSDETIFSVSGSRTTRDSDKIALPLATTLAPAAILALAAILLALAALAATIFAAAILVALETVLVVDFFALAAVLFAAGAALAALVGADGFTACREAVLCEAAVRVDALRTV